MDALSAIVFSTAAPKYRRREAPTVRRHLLRIAAVLLVGFVAAPSLASEGRLTTGSYHAKTSLSGYVRYSMYPYPEYEKGYGSIIYGSGGVHVAVGGWARFGLAAIPDDATVTGVDLLLYQYWSWNPRQPGAQARAVLVQNVLAPADTLYGYVSLGTAISGVVVCQDGWNSIPLNDLANAAVESCLTQGYVDVGIQGALWSPALAYGYDGPSDLKACLYVTFSSSTAFCDVSALSGRLSSFPCRASEAETVSFWVSCQGESSPGSVMAYLALDGVTEDSQAMGEIRPGETLTACLAFRAPQQEKKLHIACYTNVPNDSFRNNDTTSFDCWVFPAYTTAAVDFEPDHSPSFPPAGWVTENGGDTAYKWQRNPVIDLLAHTGRYYTYSRDGQSPDDWLITGGLAPSTTTGDTIGVFLCSSDPVNQTLIEIWSLRAQGSSARRDLLLDAVLDPRAWREYRVSLDEYDDTIVYLGFRRFLSGAPGAHLDDVWFSCPMATGVAEPTRPLTPAARFFLTPNLARGLRVRLNWILAAPAEVRIDVVDAVGRRWSSTVLPPLRTEGSTTLTLEHLPAGAYFARVVSGAHAQTLKFVCER